MTAPTMQQPVIPPRPSKSPAKDLLAATSTPLVPPRPTNKRIDRSKSPNPDRFAQSPFTDGLISPLAAQFSPSDRSGEDDHHDSVPMPSVGEEGLEYSVITAELKGEGTEDPEQTRSVAQDLKLHAPKPSLPASSAKERLQTVTRTDSDKAASFGIGKPGYLEGRSASRNGLKKKSSTSFSTTSEQDHQLDDEHGIPEIGQRVPMNPHLGDVQAPSPAPGSDGNGKNHSRRHSSRGLPPGSYGMHGHGVDSQDELDKAYYKKHPELLQREHHTPLHDRQNDFALSSNDLNKLVRETAKRRSGIDFDEYRGTPNEEVAFQAHEEYASRMATPRPVSIVLDGSVPLEDPGASEDKPIHVDDPKHPEQYSYGAESPVETHGHEFEAPILAADEIEKDVRQPAQAPAIRPHLDRNSSSYDGTSRPTSRPSSRPTSIYNALSGHEFDSTPLEDVREYEPLFDDEAAKKEEEQKRESKDGSKARHYFPSKDVWEDAPTSVHYTAEVSTPDNVKEEEEEEQEDPHRRKSSAHNENRPMTPAQMFAMQQEQLAEKEANGKKHNFLPILEHKPSWVDHQPHLKTGKPNRFPSKDVWEDTPESLLYEAEVEEKPKDEKKPEVPARPSKKLAELLSHKPSVPERPKSKPQAEAASEDAAKPTIPVRPVKKLSGDSKDAAAPKPKPPVPSRPAGGKIAALQAGFMSDLNKRLQLGPQPSKKEEVEKSQPVEEKEKVPLSDARKGRARGPQRRAPTQSAAPAPAPVATKEATPVSLSVSQPQTIWNIDPEHGYVHVASDSLEVPLKETSETAIESEKVSLPPMESEKPAEPEAPKAEEEKQPEPVVPPVETEAPKETVEPSAPAEPAASETVPAPEPVAEPEEVKDLESVKEPEKVEEPEEVKEPETVEPEKPKPVEPAKSDEPVKEETLATNMAGESILEAKVEQKDDKIEPVEVNDEVKS
ncbi:hypothetical protein CI102_1907 [Trichoderma harzianum]|uniref:Altered inheritance of mitochondria protein 21 n=1 Tax=Trichoderma harzianum CBS 226.95 TaxID=983964 RepID=A0A2T4AAA9_TRIHA|nr:hypothetical protein M431DRAFT_495976 [Trichoderma harzianum CBS 226.95]PKK53270.1 hypothetical protein CI102_1907 [Trichoderma harzianum]PTB54019.1 hypothetical protein M431DRAFT_495976 [Trichoderma harzianum CBS 226.95]